MTKLKSILGFQISKILPQYHPEPSFTMMVITTFSEALLTLKNGDPITFEM